MKRQWVQEIPEESRERFEMETRTLMHQRVKVVLFVGIVLIPLFSFLDLVAVPERFLSFLSYRLVCAGIYVLMLMFHDTRPFRSHPFIVSVVIYALASGLISMMIVELGGYSSFYYPGMILVLITCSMIIPLNTSQSICMALLVYLFYTLPVVTLTSPQDRDLTIFYINNFFFLSFMVITVIQCWNDTRLRIRRFNLNLQLEFYANHLEAEVEKRARKLEESELRYRELYDNIADMVVLINKNGRVIMANPRFYALVGFDETQAGGMSLVDYIHPDDASSVRARLLERLETMDGIRDFQFRVVNVLGEVFDVDRKSVV
jgi:PAS domain S-box-containing protein